MAYREIQINSNTHNPTYEEEMNGEICSLELGRRNVYYYKICDKYEKIYFDDDGVSELTNDYVEINNWIEPTKTRVFKKSNDNKVFFIKANDTLVVSYTISDQMKLDIGTIIKRTDH